MTSVRGNKLTYVSFVVRCSQRSPRIGSLAASSTARGGNKTVEGRWTWRTGRARDPQTNERSKPGPTALRMEQGHSRSQSTMIHEGPGHLQHLIDPSCATPAPPRLSLFTYPSRLSPSAGNPEGHPEGWPPYDRPAECSRPPSSQGPGESGGSVDTASPLCHGGGGGTRMERFHLETHVASHPATRIATLL